jgi:acetolactate synthase-1/2/3 large subunit
MTTAAAPVSVTTKYSDVLADWLAELGYTTCFFLAGGNIMHLLESCSRKMRCIPVVHEVAGGIAAEYFTELAPGEKALVMVTAGPGLTNIVTALGGAWLESRELLVLGGQVKVPDLNRGEVRQRGIQEIDGVKIADPLCVLSTQMTEPVDFAMFSEIVRAGSAGRKGPVFIEIPLDVQGRQVDAAALKKKPVPVARTIAMPSQTHLEKLAGKIKAAKRPFLLIGGGIARETAARMLPYLEKMGIPVATTWNGADRVPADHPFYFGRPNTWGMRYSNLVMQQADLLVALGTRLGMQQTGFNWQEFIPVGEVVQIDCDEKELKKGHPKVAWPICADANPVLDYLAKADLGDHSEWVAYAREVKAALPLNEPANQTGEGFVSPHRFVEYLGKKCTGNDIIIPCSSGGAFTIMMMVFAQKAGQWMLSNKGSASMGYGLSGAIGAAFAGKGRRTILVEGDGGFAQNIQEIGTVAANRLNLKIFIFEDNGYASIRMTQSSYFSGRYVGCDLNTGLGLPNWEKLFDVYGIPAMRIKPGYEKNKKFAELFNMEGPAAFIVTIDPKQTYFPKITSRVTETGSMASNPLHKMTPELDAETLKKLGKYL